MADYRRLLIWQKAHDLALNVYKLTSHFPSDEQFGLISQMRRAGVSVPANIAEGTGRGSQAELARFCRIARGSLNEVEYYLLLAKELRYVGNSDGDVMLQEISATRRMLTRFMAALN